MARYCLAAWRVIYGLERLMYLVNNFGRVVEIDDPDIARRHLKSKRMSEATPEQVANYLQHSADRSDELDPQATVYYQTVPASPDGYGMSRNHLKRELAYSDIMLSENFKGQKVGLLYNYPYGLASMRTDVKLIYTMFESDEIPQDWPEHLALADEVMVPSKWCADVFAKAGVQATVVPLGYNSDVFRLVERPRRDVFTFLHYDSFNMRKGFSEVMQAFDSEFKKDEPVRLVLKTVQNSAVIPILPAVYPQIKTIFGFLEESDLLQVLTDADCFVYPSRGEGFGITPLEAMATGLPAIVPNAHGITEYFNPKFMREVKISGSCPGLYNRFKGQGTGKMVIADVADLRKQMRYAFEHQAEMRKLGQAASQYVQEYTYKRTARGLAAVIDKWRSADVVKRTDPKVLAVERV